MPEPTTLVAAAKAISAAAKAAVGGGGLVAGSTSLSTTTASLTSAQSAGQILKEMVKSAVKGGVRVAAQGLLHEGIREDPQLQKLAVLALRTGAIKGGLARLNLQAPDRGSIGVPLSSERDFKTWSMGKDLLASPVVKPDQIHARFQQLNQNLDSFGDYLMRTAPRFATEVERRAAARLNAQGPGDLDSALTQVRKSTSSSLSERMVRAVFAPLFDKVWLTQPQVSVGSSYTKLDFFGEGAKRPLVLGRGQGMAVGQGGSLALEVKVGRSPYIWGQRLHLTSHQVPGLRVADGSLVVVSKDIRELPGAKETQLRSELESAGSRAFAFLPRKAAIDAVCERLVNERFIEITRARR